MKNQQIAAALCAVSALTLTACGGSGGSGGAVTVTVTPTVTAGSTNGASTPKTAATSAATSDVTGRGYDFGTVTRLEKVGGTEVITLDRWTFKGIDDKKLADNGVPLAPFKGSPFENQNSKLTYDIPVAEDARILYHHCVAADEPQQTRSATMQEIAALRAPENLVLVRLDEQGRAVAVDNLPGCAG
jgi:hypothetical protein